MEWSPCDAWVCSGSWNILHYWSDSAWRMVNHSNDMLGQFSIALQKLIESGAWSNDDELEVKIAGTLPKDKFIVIQNKTKRNS